MNFQLATIVNTTSDLTMSSREIADLTNKRHPDVKRDIVNMLEQLKGDVSSFARTYFDSQNRQQTEFDLNKELTLTLVSGYNVELRNNIIKRWMELEAQAKQAFAVPQTFAQALALAAQQALELEQKQLQLEAAKPKVEYVDNYVDRNHLKSVTDVAKEIGVSGKALGKWLREEGHAWSKHSSLRWTQPFMDKGYGEMKQYTSAGGFDGTQALVTASGDLFIKQNFSK